jgi:hypothetical protein
MKVDTALGWGAGDAEHLIFVGRHEGKKKGVLPPPFADLFLLGLGLEFGFSLSPPLFCVLGLIPTLIYASRLGSDTIDRNRIATSTHVGYEILSRHERERRGAGRTFVGRGTRRGCWWRRSRHGDGRCRGGAGDDLDEIPATFRLPTAQAGDAGGE